ncbi:2-amino-4-hydroxy-6-hydroxymethyldihydropteridine diphosphokinase [Shewanella yunxiaonensis]|uniref:2-amino-4-hydroxy-6-hydroxymethyldihydropteridine diphosphokinase n=1 Tax=Shewanella yunxiaonensis TaxID=2829809 RepID=A0ABX7YRQ7_9GAMM|nr:MULTISPECIES: 2-amino-4-hydroxy-6-hydroxymethyldihydropteridine diphosphokinase [Shewanella]MDF0533783.1 2-amino-4-hydroxy-6-hydroxymethyldihydropteridine diphosphokinase [Shewanella sp. A32]QUN04981.1 2-amino-4-hydroxy-6-hydroxymethyldihydropteridine diphosphokinase [Shewanella yunxiaonensis]
MAKIYISLGSNIEPQRYLLAGLQELLTIFGDISCSPVYESESVGFKGDNFLNMVVSAHTLLPVEAVIASFKAIELQHGRLPGAKKFASRTLDLDLLLYDDLICNTPVILPRPEILTNAFVLWPLAELAPALVHPTAGKSYAQLWAEYDKSRQKLWPVAIDFGLLA